MTVHDKNNNQGGGGGGRQEDDDAAAGDFSGIRPFRRASGNGGGGGRKTSSSSLASGDSSSKKQQQLQQQQQQTSSVSSSASSSAVAHAPASSARVGGIPGEDLQAVRVLVGMGVMEGMKRANRSAYLHPLTLMLWTLLALLADTTMSWWPRAGVWWSYAVPLTGFGAMAIPLMVGVEYLHRNYFERLLRLTLGSTDLLRVTDYYDESPSQLWVCTHHGDVIGCIALDATATATSALSSVIKGETGEKGWREVIKGAVAGEKKKKDDDDTQVNEVVADALDVEHDVKSVERETTTALRKRNVKAQVAVAGVTPSPSPSGIARIRHLHVDSPYRNVQIGGDLVDVALEHAFIASSHIDRVIVYRPPYASPYATQMFAKRGFVPCNEQESRAWSPTPKGVNESSLVLGLGGKGQWMEVTRKRFEARKGKASE